MKGPLGWLSAKLGATAHGKSARSFTWSDWVQARAVSAYRRRLAAQSSTLPVPFDVPFDLTLRDAYIPVPVDGDVDPATVVASCRGTLVLGPPGSGKSTFLRYLQWSSGTGVGPVGARLAVAVPLVHVERLDDVTAAIVDSFERDLERPGAGDLVRRELGRPAPNLLILFDGLDEVGRDKRAGVARAVAAFATQHPSLRFVVTCRTQAYDGVLDEAVDRTVHMQPLSDEMVADFLRAWPATTSSRTVDWLTSAVGETPWLAPLVRNPLVLTKLAVVHSTTYGESVGQLLHDRLHLCHEVADLLLARWKPEHNTQRREVKRAVLQHLAADALGVEADPRGMRYEDILAEIRVVLPRYDRASGTAAEVLDEIVERSGLLVRVEGGERYRFAHRAMQQYFAALELRDRPDEVLRRYRLDRDAWRGVLELSCAGDRNSTAVIAGLVEEGDTAAALACLADATQVDPSVRDRVIETAKAALVEQSTGAADTSDDEVVQSWGRFVSSPQPHGRSGFDFLASKPSSRAAAALAVSRLPAAADVLAGWASYDEKMLPQLERMGALAIPPLAGLAASGSMAAAQALDRIVNPGAPSGPLAGRPPGSPGPPGVAGVSDPGGVRGQRRQRGPRRPRRPRRPFGRPRVVPVALVALGVLAVAVVVVRDRSGDDPVGGEGEASATPGDSEPARAPGSMELVWSTPPTHVVSEPILAGGNVVAHVVDGDGLALVGYDPASGEEVWRRPSTASQIPTGVVMSVVSDGDRVFHLSPQPGDSATVEAVDATTGDLRWRTESSPGGFGDPVDFCAEDSLCVSALSAGGVYQRWSIDAATGEVAGVAGYMPPSVRARAQPIEGRSLGYGLVDLYPSRDIARVIDGRIVWRRAPSDLFGGHDVSSDFGWSWRATDDLLIGSLGTAVPAPEFGSAEAVPQYTAGIDASSGVTLWVAEGDPQCGDRLNELDLRVNGAQPWLRCRITGTLDWEDSAVTGAEVDAVIEGFDPSNGEATWTAELRGASGLYVDAQPLVRFGQASFALTLDDGSLHALDVSTGQTIDVAPDTVGWCFTDNTYQQAEGPDPSRVGVQFTTPCDVTGEPHQTPAEPDGAIGIQADGIFVWVDADGLHGARLGG